MNGFSQRRLSIINCLLATCQVMSTELTKFKFTVLLEVVVSEEDNKSNNENRCDNPSFRWTIIMRYQVALY
jgi:hypothetical protein